MMRRLEGGTEPRASDSEIYAFDPKVLAQLGLKPPPADPRLLAAYLDSEDAADAEVDSDGFRRGIRRAARLGLAFSAKLHRKARQTWTVWVRERFKAGYECYHRYHRAAELQVGLIARGLPALVNENQARALAPYRRHEEFWSVLASDTFKQGFPNGVELKGRIRKALGLEALAAASTARIKLHRSLERIMASTSNPDDDLAVKEALGIVRRAISVLERGGTRAT